jgi:hypothetical protein
MKRLSDVCILIWIMGCQVAIPSLAMEQEVSDTVPEIRQDIIAQSSTSVTPAPHFKNVKGTLKEIQGNVYVVEGESTQKLMRLEIGQDTAFPNGPKKLGQVIQALVFSNNGHALIVR